MFIEFEVEKMLLLQKQCIIKCTPQFSIFDQGQFQIFKSHSFWVKRRDPYLLPFWSVLNVASITLIPNFLPIKTIIDRVINITTFLLWLSTETKTLFHLESRVSWCISSLTRSRLKQDGYRSEWLKYWTIISVVIKFDKILQSCFTTPVT